MDDFNKFIKEPLKHNPKKHSQKTQEELIDEMMERSSESLFSDLLLKRNWTVLKLPLKSTH